MATARSMGGAGYRRVRERVAHGRRRGNLLSTVDCGDGAILETLATDGTAACPPALAAVPPEVPYETGKPTQQRIERNHQHRKGGIPGLRGFKTLAGARVLGHARAFLHNCRGDFSDLGGPWDKAPLRTAPLVGPARDAPTTEPPTRCVPVVPALPGLRR